MINLQQQPMLIRREFWEHRWAFQYTPLIIAGLALLLAAMAMFFAAEIDGTRLFTDSAIREFADQSQTDKRNILRVFLLGSNVNFNGIMQIVLFFYLVGTLYDERKDRSILFWKSLPVSDTNTIVSKVLTAGIAVPLIYMLVVAVLQLILLLVMSGYALSADVPVWSTVWQPSNLPGIWTSILVAIPVQMLWALPLFGWFLLVSAVVPRLPWLFALAVPGLAGLFQNYFSILDNLQMASKNIWFVFLERFGNGILPISLTFDDGDDFADAMVGNMENAFTISEAVGRLARPDMLFGIVIGLVFLYAAIKLRARATDR